MSCLVEETIQVDRPVAKCKKATRSLDPANVGEREVSPKRLRRARVHFSPAATRLLEDAFSAEQYPDYKERSRIAGAIKVSEPRIQTWFQNKRSRVLRRLRREPPQDMSDRTSGTRGAGKRDKTATSVPSDHSHKRLCIDTDESTALQPHYNGKTHTPLEEEQHRCIQLPLTTMFTLPAIQSHIPPLPGHLRSTVAAEPGWADCFVYPPPNACFQHQHLGAAATWPSHPEPYSHLMLCLPLASGETYSFSRCVPSPIPRDVADLWRQDLGAHTSGCVML